jgi:hypothetical protein
VCLIPARLKQAVLTKRQAPHGRTQLKTAIAFLSLAFGCLNLLTAIRSQVKTTGGKVGLGLLLVAALGMTLSALGTADPITVTKDEMTIHGRVHGLGALLGIPTFPMAATLIAKSLSPDQVMPSRRVDEG